MTDATPPTLADRVTTLGLDRVLEVAVEWWRENRHHDIPLADLETSIPDWGTLLRVVVAVILDPDGHPLRVEPGVQDFITYLQEASDGW